MFISAPTIKDAWQETARRLYNEGTDESSLGLYRRAPAVLEIHDTKGEHYDSTYPFPVSDIANGNTYFLTGDGEDLADEETKAYRRRIFRNEDGLPAVLEQLQKNPEGKRAFLSFHQPMTSNDYAPLHALWMVSKNGALHMHVHFLDSDGLRHLLPSLSRFASLQHHASDALGIKHGQYRVFVDSLSYKTEDKNAVDMMFG